MRAKVVDIEKEMKKRERMEKLNNKLEDAKNWVIRNKGTIVTLAPIVIGGTATITKVVGKRINLHKEESMKNLYCYDASLGHYWKLRRKLNNRDWLEIDRRKGNGERLGDILSSMRVLR